MLFVSRTRDAHAIAVVARYVVLADWAFTTPAVVIQPLTGFYLAHLAGFAFDSTWIIASFGLYLLAGACWLPVVWMQLRMRDMALQADADGGELPDRYWRLLRWWVALGIVAFLALVAVFYLMVAKQLPY
jgi:uncharacterized membrane protein